jgi:hypothetical protein
MGGGSVKTLLRDVVLVFSAVGCGMAAVYTIDLIRYHTDWIWLVALGAATIWLLLAMVGVCAVVSGTRGQK